ncbi:MAG TPA: flotillin family protein, partial [Thermoanaerobaculia bacterium]|nr:flotillin family protein [Thermoanaerobaculia bacterium]
PEEVNQDKLRFAEKLLEEAEHDLSRLGLILDVLKIQNVADEVGYLNSLGRKQTAALDKSARVAEAKAHAEASVREAENNLSARLALVDAEGAIAQAEADKRITQCVTGQEAMIAEEVGKVTAAIAKAEAELKVQKARLEQVRLKLEADVVAPARADMEKKQAEARGRAAKIVEDGRATAAVLTQMIETWKAAGPNARDIFLMQKLQSVMSSLVETIGSVKVDRVAYLPASAKVAQGVQLVEQVKAAFGVDLAKVVGRLGAPEEAPVPAKLTAAEALGATAQTAPARPKT